MLFCSNINSFFEELLSNLEYDQATKAYIISIFNQNKNTNNDLSKDSLTLLFAQAKNNQDFYDFQKLGDWIFFSKSYFPEHLNAASENYYNSLAQISYYNCYRILNKQWKLFELLADDFIYITAKTRNLILNKC